MKVTDEQKQLVCDYLDAKRELRELYHKGWDDQEVNKRREFLEWKVEVYEAQLV